MRGGNGGLIPALPPRSGSGVHAGCARWGRDPSIAFKQLGATVDCVVRGLSDSPVQPEAKRM